MSSGAGSEVTLQPKLKKRRVWVVALACAAIGIAGASIAAASGLLDFRDPGANEATFPNEITCRQGTNLCTPGRSADGQQFKLFKVGESATNVQVVGAGVNTGDGTQVTPLICTPSGNGIQCGSQPPGGEKLLALYIPA